MSAPRTLAEAEAQCRDDLGVDLTKSGRNMTACMDLLAPFCPNGVTADLSQPLPRCSGAGPSAAKAAVLLKEAEAVANANREPPWLLIVGVGALVALGVVVVIATK